MAQHGKDTVVLVGAYNLTSFLDNSEEEVTVELPEKTTYGSNSKSFQVGHDDGMATVEGYGVGAAATDIDFILSGLKRQTGQVVTISKGSTSGVMVGMLRSILNKFTTSASISGLVRVIGGFKADAGGLDFGHLLLAPSAKTATAATAAIDNAAATTGGGAAHLHVTAASGTTPTLDVIIEDSANGSSWVTIGTFTQVTTTPGAQRITITGTVRRYVRATHTIGGTSPSYTLAIAFARK